MTGINRILVLFDIDGTLIQTARAGLRGLNAAVERIHGRTGALDGIPVAGRTDRAILHDVFARLGLEWDEGAIEAVQEAYFTHLAHEISRPLVPPPGDFGVLPGVEATLRAMEQDPTFVVALLTGNFERGASIKLGHFGLWERFKFGAFGDRHVNRRDLVPVARELARDAGLGSPAVVIIGDTPLDVDCAHAHGAVAVAVATGNYAVDELTATGADLVIETLDALDLTALGALVASRAKAASERSR